jgi:hypothetical protein
LVKNEREISEKGKLLNKETRYSEYPQKWKHENWDTQRERKRERIRRIKRGWFVRRVVGHEEEQIKGKVPLGALNL